MLHVKTIEGHLQAQGLKFAIIASRFNDIFVDKLVGGAVDYLVRHGADREDLTIVRIPGAFEMPLVAKKMAATGKYDGVLCLGAVIRGATPHFDFVSNEAAKGIAQASMETGVPIGFGILTTDTIEQTIERSGSKAGNKGVETAAATLETIQVLKQIS